MAPKNNERLEVLAISNYTDKKSGEEKSRFTKVGSAWATKDGLGFSITLDIPTGVTKYLVKPPKEWDDGEKIPGYGND